MATNLARPARYAAPMTDYDDYLAAAWDEVHANTPPGWYVGKPGYGERYNQWSMHAFVPSEKAVVGKRSRGWTAVGPTELRCVQEKTRCLAELREGRWPK